MSENPFQGGGGGDGGICKNQSKRLKYNIYSSAIEPISHISSHVYPCIQQIGGLLPSAPHRVFCPDYSEPDGRVIGIADSAQRKAGRVGGYHRSKEPGVDDR